MGCFTIFGGGSFINLFLKSLIDSPTRPIILSLTKKPLDLSSAFASFKSLVVIKRYSFH